MVTLQQQQEAERLANEWISRKASGRRIIRVNYGDPSQEVVYDLANKLYEQKLSNPETQARVEEGSAMRARSMGLSLYDKNQVQSISRSQGGEWEVAKVKPKQQESVVKSVKEVPNKLTPYKGSLLERDTGLVQKEGIKLSPQPKPKQQESVVKSVKDIPEPSEKGQPYRFEKGGNTQGIDEGQGVLRTAEEVGVQDAPEGTYYITPPRTGFQKLKADIDFAYNAPKTDYYKGGFNVRLAPHVQKVLPELSEDYKMKRQEIAVKADNLAYRYASSTPFKYLNFSREKSGGFEFVSRGGVGIYEGLREKPATAGTFFAVSYFATPMIAGTASAYTGSAVGQTALGKGAGWFIGKTATIGLPTLYGGAIAYRAYNMKDSGEAGQFVGEKFGTELAPAIAGGYLGLKTYNYLGTLDRTRGLQEIRMADPTKTKPFIKKEGGIYKEVFMERYKGIKWNQPKSWIQKAQGFQKGQFTGRSYKLIDPKVKAFYEGQSSVSYWKRWGGNYKYVTESTTRFPFASTKTHVRYFTKTQPSEYYLPSKFVPQSVRGMKYGFHATGKAWKPSATTLDPNQYISGKGVSVGFTRIGNKYEFSYGGDFGAGINAPQVQVGYFKSLKVNPAIREVKVPTSFGGTAKTYIFRNPVKEGVVQIPQYKIEVEGVVAGTRVPIKNVGFTRILGVRTPLVAQTYTGGALVGATTGTAVTASSASSVVSVLGSSQISVGYGLGSLFTQSRLSSKPFSSSIPISSMSSSLSSSFKSSTPSYSAGSSSSLKEYSSPITSPRASKSSGSSSGSSSGFSSSLIPRVPRPIFSLGANFGMGGWKKLKTSAKYGYTPDYTSLIKGVKGKQTKGIAGGKFAGFEKRPVTKNWIFDLFKKKKKKKRSKK